jgi:hypothetical protein
VTSPCRKPARIRLSRVEESLNARPYWVGLEFEFKGARRDGAWGDPSGTATELTIEVLPLPTVHAVRMRDLLRWLEAGARSGEGRSKESSAETARVSQSA